MIRQFIKDNFQNGNQIKSTDSKPRIEFIDLAKGLCILLVVIYHTEVIKFDMLGIKSLRMPLYFILSGLFFKTYGGVAQLAIKKINKILIPFLFFYLVSWAECQLLEIAPWNTNPIAEPIYALFTQRIGPIWFLECLFLVSVVFCIIFVSIKNELARFILVVLMGVMGSYLATNRIFLPCQFDVVFTAMPFFYFGYMLKKTTLLYPSKYDHLALPAGIMFVVIGSSLYFIFDKPFIGFWDNTIKGSLLLNYLLSVILVIGVLLICKRIKWFPVISYIGRYSIIVLVMHQIVLQAMTTFRPYLLGYGINYIYFIFTFGISWISIPFIRKYLPQFTAQKDLITDIKIPKFQFVR